MTDTEKLAIAVKALRAIAGYCNQGSDAWRAEHEHFSDYIRSNSADGWKINALSDHANDALTIVDAPVSFYS